MRKGLKEVRGRSMWTKNNDCEGAGVAGVSKLVSEQVVGYGGIKNKTEAEDPGRFCTRR